MLQFHAAYEVTDGEPGHMVHQQMPEAKDCTASNTDVAECNLHILTPFSARQQRRSIQTNLPLCF